ncbi:hypothetical protein NMY22_g5336 [Coprinellus aureogranulatus]|nr:hypothetical protein NMY22_g5336 [Coprinellus aureogranulatus]
MQQEMGLDCTSNPPCFIVPTDIWLRILSEYVEPRKLLRLARVCKRFYSIVQARALWVRALHIVCERYGLFKPTFPMDKMTLPELQHAVTAPSYFPIFMGCYDEMSLEAFPFQTRIHPFRGYIESDSPRTYVDRFILVPGGRFLFTQGNQGVNLWDLGYSSRQYLEPLSLVIGEIFGRVVIVGPTADGRELLVLVECLDELSLYRINPALRRPDYYLEAELKLDLPEFERPDGEDDPNATIGRARLTPRTVILWRPPYFIAWDWTTNTGCKWRSSRRLGYQPMVYMSETSIICCDANEWVVWDLPTSRFTPEIPIIRNDVKTPTDFPRIFGRAISMATGYWPSCSLGESFCLITFRNPPLRGQAVTWYSVQSRQTTANAEHIQDSIPADVLEGGEDYPVHDPCDDEWDIQLKPGTSQLSSAGSKAHAAFCARSTQDELVVTIFPVPGGYGDYAVFRRVTGPVIPPDDEFVEEMIGFCAATGRLVYYTDHGQVVISDYLQPPPG